MQDEKKALTSEETMAQHAEKIDALSKGLEFLTKENAALRKSIADNSNGATAEKVKPTIPTDTFKVKDKTYKFRVAHFRMDNKIITATDALTDEAILAALVEIGSGVLEEVAE
jgi:hypothetical protein